MGREVSWFTEADLKGTPNVKTVKTERQKKGRQNRETVKQKERRKTVNEKKQ